MKLISWWPVARSDDGLTVFITVDLTAQALQRVVGVDVQESDESVTLKVIGQAAPEDEPRMLNSIIAEYLVDLSSNLGSRPLLHP